MATRRVKIEAELDLEVETEFIIDTTIEYLVNHYLSMAVNEMCDEHYPLEHGGLIHKVTVE